MGVYMMVGRHLKYHKNNNDSSVAPRSPTLDFQSIFLYYVLLTATTTMLSASSHFALCRYVLSLVCARQCKTSVQNSFLFNYCHIHDMLHKMAIKL